MKLFRDFASQKWTDRDAKHEAIVRLEEAYNKFGMTVCVRVMQFNEIRVLHQLGDELAGRLKFSILDYQFDCAIWAPGRKAYAESSDEGVELSRSHESVAATWRALPHISGIQNGFPKTLGQTKAATGFQSPAIDHTSRLFSREAKFRKS